MNQPEGYVLVQIKQLAQWREWANNVAAWSKQADRSSEVARLKASISSAMISATLPPASAAGEREDLSQWEKARFGYFDQAGRFVEFSGEDNELPNDSSPRWVGGLHDMQLLRAALATKPQAEQPATPPAQTVQDDEPRCTCPTSGPDYCPRHAP